MSLPVRPGPIVVITYTEAAPTRRAHRTKYGPAAGEVIRDLAEDLGRPRRTLALRPYPRDPETALAVDPAAPDEVWAIVAGLPFPDLERALKEDA